MSEVCFVSKMNKLTKQQEKRFDKKFSPEQSNKEFIDDVKILDAYQEIAIKQFIANELALQRKEIIEGVHKATRTLNMAEALDNLSRYLNKLK